MSDSPRALEGLKGTKQDDRKVFGIGFHKTGTTSLGVALEMLGYRVCHGARPLRMAFGQQRMMDILAARRLELIYAVAQQFNGFRDNPWYILFREMDRRFPGSKFVLTTRDGASWLRSAIAYFGDSQSDLRRWIYGAASPIGNERLYLDRFRCHEQEVREYFAGRNEDLLVVDWQRGDGWTQLTRFLQKPHPAAPFPWENARASARVRPHG